MSELELLLNTIKVGWINGFIIALIALGYTMVYGIIELINFAHGDLFMLGAFLALTLVGLLGLNDPGVTTLQAAMGLAVILLIVPCFTAGVNWTVDRLAYKPLRSAPKLAALVSAIGVSFIFMNLGLFWAGLPMDVFGQGRAAASKHHVPALVSGENLLTKIGIHTSVQLTPKDMMVVLVTVPLLIGLTMFVKRSKMGKAMRATAQNPTAAQLMGIDINRVIGVTFVIGGALGGFASVIYAFYNNTVEFQMGFRNGMDAFTAAVLGGIGNLPGAALGGLLIGLIRAFSDVYIEARWTPSIVFGILILILIFRPSGLLGARTREKV